MCVSACVYVCMCVPACVYVYVYVCVCLSGWSLSHSDIGGYTMIDDGLFTYLRDKELLVRECDGLSYDCVKI